MITRISIAVLVTFFIGLANAQQIEPKHTFNVEIGLPNGMVNEAFGNIMQGLVNVAPYYQFCLKKHIAFGAGIEVNGIASTRDAYPFYKFIDSLDMELMPGEVKTIDSMTVNYFPGLDFGNFWMEDFEETNSTGISIDTTEASLANVEIESSVVFEGNQSLKLEVTPDRPLLVCASPDGGQLLTVGKDIYLEMNYRCNQSFQINLNAITFSGNRIVPVIKLNPKTDWNKIYIRLNPYINVNGDASRFQIMFYLALADGSTQGLVYLDNIKLITN